jgi:hypothetical protein
MIVCYYGIAALKTAGKDSLKAENRIAYSNLVTQRVKQFTL